MGMAVPLISVTQNYASLLTRKFSGSISNVKFSSTSENFSMKFHIQHDPASGCLRNNSIGIVFGKVVWL